MPFDIRSDKHTARGDRAAVPVGSPGKQTLVEQIYGSPVQRLATAGAGAPPARVHAAAEAGTAGAGGPLPHLDAIQRSFGRNDVSGVRTHTDAAASSAARSMGAEAFTTGERVAFGATPSLRVAAHEAAHVVQQRAGVQLSGGVGAAGDRHEQLADAVADRVERGESAEPLLGATAAAPVTSGSSVQHLLLGPNQEWNTTNPQHRDAITQHLRTLSSDSLVYIRDQISIQPNLSEYLLLQVIALELARAGGLEDVQQAIDQHGAGIWTKAAVFVNGNLIGETNPIRSGAGQGEYSMLDPALVEPEDNDELHVSSLDSEVGTLEEVTGLLHPYTNQQLQSIRIVLSGNLGPCDGCKLRAQVYVNDTAQLFLGATVVLESNYFTATAQTVRQNVPTMYGYGDDQQRSTSSGRDYFTRNVHPQ